MVRLTCRVEPIWGSVGHAGGQILLGPRGLCAAVAGLEGALPMAAARSHWRSIVLGSYAWLAAYLPSYLARPALGARSLSGPWGRALSGPWGPPALLGRAPLGPWGPPGPWGQAPLSRSRLPTIPYPSRTRGKPDTRRPSVCSERGTRTAAAAPGAQPEPPLRPPGAPPPPPSLRHPGCSSPRDSRSAVCRREGTSPSRPSAPIPSRPPSPPVHVG